MAPPFPVLEGGIRCLLPSLGLDKDDFTEARSYGSFLI